MCDSKCRRIHTKSGGGSEVEVCVPPTSNVFIFMQFSAKIMLNNKLAPPTPPVGLAHRLGNSWPTTEKDWCPPNIFLKKGFQKDNTKGTHKRRNGSDFYWFKLRHKFLGWGST